MSAGLVANLALSGLDVYNFVSLVLVATCPDGDYKALGRLALHEDGLIH